MSTVTVQLGQAGNQLGSELFSVLAEELRSGQNELSPAADAFFYMAQVGGETRCGTASLLLVAVLLLCVTSRVVAELRNCIQPDFRAAGLLPPGCRLL